MVKVKLSTKNTRNVKAKGKNTRELETMKLTALQKKDRELSDNFQAFEVEQVNKYIKSLQRVAKANSIPAHLVLFGDVSMNIGLKKKSKTWNKRKIDKAAEKEKKFYCNRKVWDAILSQNPDGENMYEWVCVPLDFHYVDNIRKRTGDYDHTIMLLIKVKERKIYRVDNIFNSMFNYDSTIQPYRTTPEQERAVIWRFKGELRRAEQKKLGRGVKAEAFHVLPYTRYYTYRPRGCQLVTLMVMRAICEGEQMPKGLKFDPIDRPDLLRTWLDLLAKVTDGVHKANSTEM